MIEFSETLPIAERWTVSRRINALAPPHWKAVRLGDIAEVQNGFPFESAFFNGSVGFPVIRIRDVGADDTATLYNGEYDEAFIVRPGDILIGMDGEFRCRRWRGRPGLLNQRVCRILLRSKFVDERFLFLVLQPYLTAVESVTSSITVRHLSSKTVEDLEIALPPLPEQRRIVAKIEELQARTHRTREALEAIPPLLEQFRKTVLAAAFRGDLTADWRARNPDVEPASELLQRLYQEHERAGTGHGGKAAVPSEDVHLLHQAEFPESWAVAELQWICEPGRAITYGILKPGPELPSGVPYVRVADFPNDRLNLSTIRNTSPEIAAQYKRSELRTGDLLLSIRGTVGRVCRVPAELNRGNITQDTVRISVSSLIDPDYVQFSLKTPSAQARMRKATKGVAVRGINVGDVRVLQIPLAPTGEQREVARRLAGVLNWVASMEERVSRAREELNTVERAILSKAFRGELVPQDPNDEPASVLLERIRAEREREGTRRGRGRRPAHPTAP